MTRERKLKFLLRFLYLIGSVFILLVLYDSTDSVVAVWKEYGTNVWGQVGIFIGFIIVMGLTIWMWKSKFNFMSSLITGTYFCFICIMNNEFLYAVLIALLGLFTSVRKNIKGDRFHELVHELCFFLLFVSLYWSSGDKYFLWISIPFILMPPVSLYLLIKKGRYEKSKQLVD